MDQPILIKHLNHCVRSLESMSEAATIADHNGNKGVIREGLISNFLEQNMPEFVRYHSGEIFDCIGDRSGQIDIVMHPITSPKLHLHGAINLFPTETVLAAIEVKSSLNKQELMKVMTACDRLKKLNRFNNRIDITPHGMVDTARVPNILFCYKGYLENTLFDTMERTMEERSIPHENLPDLIVILQQGYCLERFVSITDKQPLDAYYRKVSSKNDNVLLGLFIYLMKLIEAWSSNSSQYAMPIKNYRKTWERVYGTFNF